MPPPAGAATPATPVEPDRAKYSEPVQPGRAAAPSRPPSGRAGPSTGEYAERGDYHRAPDASWDYLPTYLAKLARVRGWLDALPAGTRVLDAGCGEGVLVEEFAGRLAIEGVDPNYASAHVQRGIAAGAAVRGRPFDRALCLDVLEHLAYEEQPRALRELHRVLTPDGELLVSVPNLAHLQSRVHFLLTGRLIRTASEVKHPGDRPIAEYLRLFDAPASTSSRGTASSRRFRSSPPGSAASRPIAPGCTARSPACCRCRRWRSWRSSRSRRAARTVASRRAARRARQALALGSSLAYTPVLARLCALGRNFAIYGLGDVATNIVSFLLLPLYARFLTPDDYGAIGLLLTVEVVAKIVFRCGLDASFMRFFYDCARTPDRQRLASTIFWFLAAVNGVILALLLLAAPFITHLFGVPGYTCALRILLAQHLRRRLLLHPVPRDADGRPVAPVRRR